MLLEALFADHMPVLALMHFTIRNIDANRALKVLSVLLVAGAGRHCAVFAPSDQILQVYLYELVRRGVCRESPNRLCAELRVNSHFNFNFEEGEDYSCSL